MQEKKKFVLAVPTVIIIIIFIIALGYLIYSKNFKPLSKEKAIELAEKSVTVDNFSCQLVIEQDGEEIVADYKRKENMVYMKEIDYEEYLNIDTAECVYVDRENKEAYAYTSDSVLESYNTRLYAGIKSLEDENYSYTFNKYEKVNGIKCASITLDSDLENINMWLDTKTGMVTKYVVTNKSEGGDKFPITYIYRYQTGNVTDDDIKIPDLSDYTVLEM